MDNKELDKAAEQYGKGSEYPQQLENAFVAGAEWYADKISNIHGAVEAIQKSWNRGELWLTEFDQDILKQIGIKI